MPGQILNRLGIHAGEYQTGDVGSADLMGMDVEIDSIAVFAVWGFLSQLRGDGHLLFPAIRIVLGIGALLNRSADHSVPHIAILGLGQYSAGAVAKDELRAFLSLYRPQ